IESVKSFLRKNNLEASVKHSPFDFDSSFEELENTFIRIEKNYLHKFIIKFQNTSVNDFLLNYLRRKKEFICFIIKGATNLEQFFRIFYYSETINPNSNKINLSEKFKEIVIGKIISEFDQLDIEYKRYPYLANSIIVKLDYIISFFDISQDNSLQDFYLVNLINYNLENLKSFERGLFINLISKIKKIKFNPTEVLENYYENIYSTDDIITFCELKELYYKEFNSFLKQNNYESDFLYIFESEKNDYTSKDELEQLLNDIDFIESTLHEYDFETDIIKIQIEDKIEEIAKKDAQEEEEREMEYLAQEELREREYLKKQNEDDDETKNPYQDEGKNINMETKESILLS